LGPNESIFGGDKGKMKMSLFLGLRNDYGRMKLVMQAWI
jgi:hypothetical protein